MEVILGNRCQNRQYFPHTGRPEKARRSASSSPRWGNRRSGGRLTFDQGRRKFRRSLWWAAPGLLNQLFRGRLTHLPHGQPHRCHGRPHPGSDRCVIETDERKIVRNTDTALVSCSVDATRHLIVSRKDSRRPVRSREQLTTASQS